MKFQPNQGSSLYKRPSKSKIAPEQEDWDSPIGTLRLSDHWNYRNQNSRDVYRTNLPIPSHSWALCINRGYIDTPWRVLQIFKSNKGNMIREIDFEGIKKEINSLL